MEVTLYRKHIHAQKLKAETLGKDVNISSKLTIKTKELLIWDIFYTYLSVSVVYFQQVNVYQVYMEQKLELKKVSFIVWIFFFFVGFT